MNNLRDRAAITMNFIDYTEINSIAYHMRSTGMLYATTPTKMNVIQLKYDTFSLYNVHNYIDSGCTDIALCYNYHEILYVCVC